MAYWSYLKTTDLNATSLTLVFAGCLFFATAFLISTPESGVDSIAITYALLDPIMTVARPVSAFLAAVTAGVAENLFNTPVKKEVPIVDFSCPVDGCCDGIDCLPEEHGRHHTFGEKLWAGLNFSITDLSYDAKSVITELF